MTVVVPGDTIVAAFRETARRHPERVAMRRHAGHRWEVVTWAAYHDAVAEVTAGLAELGIGPGERVGILSNNRVEWHYADHGILGSGAVTVPIYQTSSIEQVEYVLGHSEARACFVENIEQLGKILAARERLPKLDRVVIFEPDTESLDDPFIVGFEVLRSMGRDRLAREPDLYEARAVAVKAEDLATIVYTSGTTGPPKGAMITHGNVMWTLKNATPPFDLTDHERLLSFLPLSHIAERMMSDFLPVAMGAETWFARSLATVAEDLKACRPTVFFAVPRVWEKLQEAVVAKVGEENIAARTAIASYVRLGRYKVDRQQTGRPPGRVTEYLHRLLDRSIGATIRREMGLDQTHVMITAAAPIHPDLIRWFHAIGLPLVELYGQTEDCGPTSVNRKEHNRIGTVGPPIPGVTITIAADGEILVKGGNVCVGYYRSDEATQELLADGWMHSGDLGSIDADGFLTITGRKKDLIITAAGKNIAPQEIETDLRYHALISQAVVLGEGRRYLTGLITLDADEVRLWAERHHKIGDLEAIAADPDLISEIDTAVAEVNSRRSRVENIRKFRVLPHDFTIAENELTPTLKVKRNVVNDKYAEVIEEMYAEPQPNHIDSTA